MPAAYFGDLQASIGFLEDRHDLALGKSALFHWFGSVIPTRTLSFQTVPCEGKLTNGLSAFRWNQFHGTVLTSRSSSTPHLGSQLRSMDDYPDTGGGPGVRRRVRHLTWHLSRKSEELALKPRAVRSGVLAR